jgi:RNA polymerase primary sigma factor
VEFAPADENDVAAWCRAAMDAPVLAPDEEAQLAYRIEEGDPEARDRLVRANLRLVVEAVHRHAGDGSLLLPLLQAGTAGLLYAIEAFDPASGERFSDHAGRFVEQAIQRAISREH